MRKRILSILLALCMILVGGVMPTTAFADDVSNTADITGMGTAEEPYLIYKAAGLKAFRDAVNGQNELTMQPGAHAKLMADIDLGGEPWTPINGYTGTFEGQGHTISGLNVKDVQYAGLFGYAMNATIKNVTVAGSVEASTTNNNAYAGGIAAQVNGSAQIINCTNNAAVKATVTNNVDAAYAAYTGGMAGHASGSVKITGCINDGAVQANGVSASTNTGGMAGYAEGGAAFTNCLNTAVLSAASNHSDPEPQSEDYYSESYSRSGGIVGHATGVTVAGCYNTGAITAIGTGNYVHPGRAGGIVGHLNLSSTSGTISNCGNTGAVTVTQTFSSARAGGIAGNVSTGSSNDNATITCCYNTGTITGTHISSTAVERNYAGGIAGVLENHEGASTQISSCYWLTGSGNGSVGWNPHNVDLTDTATYSKTDFVDGTVLRLLQGDSTDGPWTNECQYVAAAGLTLPLLNWQTADSHDHNTNGLLGGCTCGKLLAGTETEPYLISTVEDLKAFRDMVNSGKTTLCAKLMNDIVLNDGTFDADGNYTPGASGKDAEQWTPIGYFKGDSDKSRYAGTFDGGGHTIRGLYVTGVECAGLFGYAGNTTIKNVTVDGYVKGTLTVGGIVGWIGDNNPHIENCVNLCRVAIDGDVMLCIGGIAGSDMGGEILNCANLGTVSASSGRAYIAYIGGIVGDASGTTVTDCYNAGNVMSRVKDGEAYIGGIAGTAYNATIANCYNVGVISKESTSSNCCVGGVAGYQEGNDTISKCYWLSSTANQVVGWSNGGTQTDVEAKTTTEFADGTVLDLLKNNRTDSSWADECKYLDAAEMTLPVFKGQGDNHDHNYEWKHTDTEHWKECGCGVIEANSTASHNEVTGNCTEGIKCACGYEMIAATSEHNWGEWQHLTTFHSRTCNNPGCGLTQSGNCSDENKDHKCDTCEAVMSQCADNNKDHKCDLCGKAISEHTGGTATCTEPAVCDVCGEKYGTVDASNHTDATEWIQTSTTHTLKCKSCDATVIAEENHQWENGACKTCGYKAPHRPATQRPEITIIGSGKVTLSANGRTATITADEGHELASVTLNGKEIATTDNLTGLKTGDKVVVTFREKADESAAEIKAVAAKVGKMQLIARSGRTAKNNVRITVKTDNKTNSLIKEIKDLGYTVKYKYYRSTKKSSAYTAKLEKNASRNSYINTAGKKGTRYYYKVRLMVYDASGNLIAKTELKQCKYAARIWNK